MFSKIIASAVNLLIFSAFSGLCNYVLLILPTGGLEQPTAALTTTIGLYLTQLMFFTIGLLISSIVKKYKAAIQVGTVFLLASYFLAIAAQYSGIPFLDLLSPLRYFDVYEVTLNGIQIFSLILAFLIVAVCLCIAAKQWKNGNCRGKYIMSKVIMMCGAYMDRKELIIQKNSTTNYPIKLSIFSDKE